MRIETKKLSYLKPYGNNAKEHPHGQIERIKESIRSFGFNDPIAIDEEGTIIEGHGRYAALTELGWEECECIILPHMTEDQKNAYRLVHNQLTMESGFDLEMLERELKAIDIDLDGFGLGLEELEKKLKRDKGLSDDGFDLEEALRGEEAPKAKRGDIYILGQHRLMCGDSLDPKDVEALMDGELADIVMTDPPYNVAYEGAAGRILNDAMGLEEWKSFNERMFASIAASTRAGGRYTSGALRASRPTPWRMRA